VNVDWHVEINRGRMREIAQSVYKRMREREREREREEEHVGNAPGYTDALERTSSQGFFT